jgi:hypothetical protein
VGEHKANICRSHSFSPSGGNLQIIENRYFTDKDAVRHDDAFSAPSLHSRLPVMAEKPAKEQVCP